MKVYKWLEKCEHFKRKGVGETYYYYVYGDLEEYTLFIPKKEVLEHNMQVMIS